MQKIVDMKVKKELAMKAVVPREITETPDKGDSLEQTATKELINLTDEVSPPK